MSNDYFKAQGWFKNYATSSEDSRGMFQQLVKEDEEAFRIASAETDRIKDMINEVWSRDHETCIRVTACTKSIR